MCICTVFAMLCRSQEANVYISSKHAAVDPGGKATREVPGAGAYDVGNRLHVLSTHKAEGRIPFGTAEKFTTSKAKVCDAEQFL